MNKDFDFESVGKRTPFRTPDGFFNDMQTRILEQASEERRRRKRLRWQMIVGGVLSAAAMIAGIVFFIGVKPDNTSQPLPAEWVAQNGVDAMDLYLQGLSDEELEHWIEFSENDIFYELTTENLNEDED